MTTPLPSKLGRARPWILIAIAWVVAFDVAFVWQHLSGAHISEFSGHPSETTHYVTALMLRDYFVARSPETKAREFVDRYAARYPNVDQHFSPPLFEALLSGWMAAFGASRMAMMMFMAALAATGATLVWSALVDDFGYGMAALGGALLLCLPLFRDSYDVLLAEPLSAIILLAAALKWGRYLNEGRTIDAIAFGALCGLGLLTDLSAFALLFQMPLSALLARQVKRLAQPATWVGLALALLIAGPTLWFLGFNGDLGRWIQAAISWEFTRTALPFYLGKLVMGLGFVLLLFFVVGVIGQFRGNRENGGKWSALAATLASSLALAAMVSNPLDARHLVPLLPIAVMFVTAGLNRLREKLSEPATDSAMPRKSPWVTAAAILSIGAIGVITAQLFEGADLHERWTGYAESAKQILTGPDRGTRRVLVSSDRGGEGALISEIAMREKQPGLVLQRSTQELLRTDRLRGGIQPRFDNSEDLAAWFPRSGFTILALDQSINEADRNAIHNQLARAVEDHPEVFWPMAQVSVTRGKTENPGILTVYRIKGSQEHQN